MATEAQRTQASEALADLQTLVPAIRAGLNALAGSGTNLWLKSFPAPQHPDPAWVPGRGQIPPSEVLARFDAIVAGAAVAKDVLTE